MKPGSSRREFLAQVSAAVAASFDGTSLFTGEARAQTQPATPTTSQVEPARGLRSSRIWRWPL